MNATSFPLGCYEPRATPSKLNSTALFERSQDGIERLEHIFDVSKLLTHFKSLEEDFPEALSIATAVFPIVSAVVIDKLNANSETLAWLIESQDESQIQYAVSKARAFYSYLIGATPSQRSRIQAGELKSAFIRDQGCPLRTGRSDKNQFLTIPLIVKLDHVFGLLQIEGRGPLSEEDVKFANMFANLIAVALDRYHRATEDNLKARNAAALICSERDDSIRSVGRLEQQRIAREQFVQSLSHDLRTPLASMNMTAQLLMRSKSMLPDEVDLVKKLLVNSKRLGRMIDSLLDANRLRAGEKLPLHMEECNFGELISQVVSELEVFSEGAIEVQCSENIFGHWDADALRRLIENLVGNAIKYGRADQPISVCLSKTNGGPILKVHNEGAPISPKDQLTLFDPFHRSVSAQRSSKAGWGIGLTLVKGIAEGHGGKVWVESDARRGTDFFVLIPYDSRIFQVPLS